jgi:uncharacterized protein YjiS (DUF1127 family)
LFPNYCFNLANRHFSHAFVAVHNRRGATYIRRATAIDAGAWANAGRGRTMIMQRNINKLYDRYRRWRRYRDTVRELQALSSHELRDLGIQRGDIGRLARQASGL